MAPDHRSRRGSDTLGRKVGAAVRRLSGGPLMLASRLDLDGDGPSHGGLGYGRNDDDDDSETGAGYDDGAYGAVINEEGRSRGAGGAGAGKRGKQRVARTVALICLGVGMVGAFGVMVWGWSGEPGRGDVGVDGNNPGVEEQVGTTGGVQTAGLPVGATAAPTATNTYEPTVTIEPTFEPSALGGGGSSSSSSPTPTPAPTERKSAPAVPLDESEEPKDAAVAAGAGAGSANGKNEDGADKDDEGGGGNNNNNDNNTNDDDGDYPIPPPPSQELLVACSAGSVLTYAGRDECRTLCAASECCFLDGKKSLSCAGRHEEECARYAEICSILDLKDTGAGGGGGGEEETDANAATEEEPAGAAETGGEDASAAGGGGDGGGQDDAEGANVPLLLPPLPADIYDICSPPSISGGGGTYAECRSACVRSECCYLPPKIAPSNGSGNGSGNGSSNSNGNGNGNGNNETDNPLSCQSSHEFECASYDEACSVLDYYDSAGNGIALTIAVPSPPPNLPDLCAPSSLAFYAGFVACHQGCFRAKCCGDGIGSFCEVSNPEVCEEYGPCDALPSNQAASSSASLGEGGQEQAANTGGAALGEGHIGEGTVEVPNNEATLEIITEVIGEAGTVKEGLADEIRSKCRTDSLATPGGVVGCADACTSAMCCFFTPSDNSGVKESGGPQSQMGGQVTASCLNHATVEWCGQFGACELLLHLDEDDATDGLDDDEATSAVQRACADIEGPLLVESEPLGEDGTGATRTTCANVCSPAHCCFTDRIDCTTEVQCDHYKDCSILYGTAPPLKSASQSLLPPKTGHHPSGGGGEERIRRHRLLRGKG